MRARRPLDWALGVIGVVALVAAGAPALAAAVPGDPRPAGADGIRGHFRAVNALSSSDAWAVGYGNRKALIAHWDGHVWAKVRSPAIPDAQRSELLGVSAVDASEVWAVGSYDTIAEKHALIEHWDGHRWTIVPEPDIGTTYDRLEAVSALSPTDVWAVGFSDQDQGSALIEHWNGAAWTQVAGPEQNGVSDGALRGVSVVSATDVWAVGFYYHGAGSKTLVDHWDGSRWTHVPSPGGVGLRTTFNAVSALSATQAWAVGSRDDGEALVARWNGTRWVRAANPPSGDSSELLGVSASSSTDVWAVGWMAGGRDRTLTLTEHWDGIGWTVVPSPNPERSHSSVLRAVSAASAADAWAAGDFSTPRPGGALFEHWDGTNWTIA